MSSDFDQVLHGMEEAFCQLEYLVDWMTDNDHWFVSAELADTESARDNLGTALTEYKKGNTE